MPKPHPTVSAASAPAVAAAPGDDAVPRGPAPGFPAGEAARTILHVDMAAQPDDVTCGPTCLHAVYRYFGDELPLLQVVDEVRQLRDGGTLAPILACHALRRGYKATIFTFDLHTLDPTWLLGEHGQIPAKLHAQMQVKDDPKLHSASKAYLEFLSLGGSLHFEDLTRALIRRKLNRNVPILVGLSSTYLYREIREVPASGRDDDILGLPAGHFVVLYGYDRDHQLVYVADPYPDNPLSPGRERRYAVPIDRVICAILLGIVTYDANLLVIEPPKKKSAS